MLWGACILGIWSCDDKVYEAPKSQSVKEVIFASGHIETQEQYVVVAAVDGYIATSYIEEGMLLNNGTLLAEIAQETQQAQLNDAEATYRDARESLQPDAPKIKELDLKIAIAEKELAHNKKVLGSYERLVQTNAVSRVDYDNQKLKTERSEKDLQVFVDSKEDLLSTLDLNLVNASNLVKIRNDDVQKYQLRASGRSQVLKCYRKEGEYIRRGETLAEMGRGTAVVKLFVEEGDINSIAIGQTVELSINTYDGVLFKGEISKIYPAFDETEQSFIVEAQFRDRPEKIFPGTQVQANILTLQKERALIIPAKSVVSGDSVATKNKGWVKVELGIKNTEWVEVLQGITQDDLILTEPKGYRQ